MTEPTDAELDELRQANDGRLNFVTLREFRTIARAALAKWGTPPAVAGEPVAWLSPWRADQVTTDYDAYGEHGIPLYTTPQPAQPQAGAVPLTDEQIDALDLPPSGTATVRDLVRIIEAAHGIGIKGGQHGTE